MARDGATQSDSFRNGTMAAAVMAAAPRPAIDKATVIGLGSGLGLLVIAIVIDGSLRSFFNLSAILIVIGGTAAVTTTCFSLEEMARSITVTSRAVIHPTRDLSWVATEVLKVAEFTRKNTVLGLQGQPLESLKNEPFLYKGLSMIVDGVPASEVETVLSREIQATLHRHTRATSVLRRAAEVSPAMGLIGTLIGLVQMLGSLSDPATIGPSMAVALITTFYGAVLANMVLTPLAAKLERNSQEENVVSQLYLLGILSIARQENPRRLEMLLNSVLPPQHRVKYFD